MLRDLLTAFSSPDPTPGGGSASALASAVGASLLMMVAGLAKTRNGSDEDRAALAAASGALASIRDGSPRRSTPTPPPTIGWSPRTSCRRRRPTSSRRERRRFSGRCGQRRTCRSSVMRLSAPRCDAGGRRSRRTAIAPRRATSASRSRCCAPGCTARGLNVEINLAERLGRGLRRHGARRGKRRGSREQAARAAEEADAVLRAG